MASLMSWICEPLARAGNIVVAIDHHGNTAAEDEYADKGFVFWWERPKDISYIVNKIGLEKGFTGKVDTLKIGALGFSLGGYSVLALAGAQLDLDQFENFCVKKPSDGNCPMAPQADISAEDVSLSWLNDPDFKKARLEHSKEFKDDRIKAVFSIAPAVGPAIIEESLRSISLPLKLVVGSSDNITPAATGAEYVASNVQGAEIEVMPEVSHMTFSAHCGWVGKLFLKELCADNENIVRINIQSSVAQDAIEFFKTNL